MTYSQFIHPLHPHEVTGFFIGEVITVKLLLCQNVFVADLIFVTLRHIWISDL